MWQLLDKSGLYYPKAKNDKEKKPLSSLNCKGNIRRKKALI